MINSVISSERNRIIQEGLSPLIVLIFIIICDLSYLLIYILYSPSVIKLPVTQNSRRQSYFFHSRSSDGCSPTNYSLENFEVPNLNYTQLCTLYGVRIRLTNPFRRENRKTRIIRHTAEKKRKKNDEYETNL